MLNYEGSCKRIDLIFRAKYPFYSTELYKISDVEYQIFIKENIDDFDLLKEEYDHSIRFITSPVHLVESPPEEYISQITHIDDKSLASNYEGLPYTSFQLSNHVECQHPNLKVCEIETDHQRRVLNFIVNTDDYSGSIDEIRKTLKEIGSPYGSELTLTATNKKNTKSPGMFEILAASSLHDFDPGYLERDERLWFDNANDIYSGSFTKNDLYFYDSKESSCLLDLSVFSNVNLRNHLLLYDVIYCILPLADRMHGFLVEQRLSKDDMFYLIDRGRLKIINTQPEFRLDHSFLKECYQINPTSVISRRALSALSAIDIVETHNNYIFKDMDFIKHLDPLLSKLSTLTNQPVDHFKKVLTWPTSALRSSFDSLNTSGTKSIPSFGVNQIITNNMTENLKNKCELEFLTSSEAIHISHALDATYFPYFEKNSGFSDQPFSILMANSLNFYKLSSLPYLKDNQDVFNPEETRNKSLELLSVFDVNDYIPVSEYLEVTEQPLSRECLNRLFSELSKLPINERDERIRIYNGQVESLLRGKTIAKGTLDLSVDTAGLFIPYFSTGAKAAGWLSKKAQEKVPIFKEMANYVSDKAHSNKIIKKEVSILTQVNRVARLKRTIV